MILFKIFIFFIFSMAIDHKNITKFIYKDFSDITYNKEAEDTSLIEKGESVHKEYEEEYNNLFGAISDFKESLNDHITESNITQNPTNKISEEEIIDIKQEAYNEGYNKAKEELEPIITQKNLEDSVLAKFSQELSKIDISVNFSENLSAQILEIIKITLSHLYKSLPTDFNKIFHEHFAPIIQNGISLGNVEIRTNASQKEIIARLIAQHIKDNISKIKLIEDDNLSTDDIKVEYANGVFQYKSDEIFLLIDRILSEHLNSR